VSRIALVGNLSIDRVAGGPPRAGGGVFWAARAAARVGADVAVATRCASRDRGVALAPLEALGLPVVCADAERTTAFSFHYEGDRRLMTVDAVGDGWSPEDVDGWAAEAVAGAEWALVAGLLRTDFPAETVAALARGRRRLALDAQGLVRLGRTGPLETDSSVDRSMLAELAVLTLNEEEDVLSLTDEPFATDPEPALELPLLVAAAASGSTVVAIVERRPPLVVSNDGGVTWREAGAGLGRGVALAISPNDPDLVLFATSERLHVSRDGGRFWAALEIELPNITAVTFAE